MKQDLGTLESIGRILGGRRTIPVNCVGTGPYGLLEIKNCGEVEERAWRFVGFASAQAAEDFTAFLRGNAASIEDGRHVEHVRWEVFCTNRAIPNATLDRIVGPT